jgi:serine O-acetyltransferase
MNVSLPKESLCEYVRRQAGALFPDGEPIDIAASWIADALSRLETSMEAVADPAYQNEGKTFFNHLHGDQYAMFLYLLANTAYRATGPRSVCEKLFLLNKALYGIDAFYEVELPRIFLFCHAGGTVLGRAMYSDYFLVYQHCTIGSARAEDGASRGIYPVLGTHVSLYAGASVLGACKIGDNCKISAGSVVINKRVKPHTMYRGTPQSHELVPFPFPDNIWKK